MATPRFAGEPVTLGGVEYIAPPMALLALTKLKTKIDALGASDTSEEEQLAISYDLIHASIARNYPEIDREDLDVMIEIDDLAPALDVVMRLSGLTKRVPATDGPEGNGRRGASARSTGTRSTPGSARRSAGRGSTSTST